MRRFILLLCLLSAGVVAADARLQVNQLSGFGVRQAASGSVIDSWTYRTGNGGDVSRVTNVALEGFDGSSWITVDSFAPPTTTDTETTRTNGVEFATSAEFEDWRIVWTLTQGAAQFVHEIAITVDGIDVTSGASPTESPTTSNNENRIFDDNNSTQYPELANVGSGQIVEVNI